MAKYVYDLAEGDKEQKDLLGGKGAGLAEMTNIGLPVPPGFTISTAACRAFLSEGGLPAGLEAEVGEHLRRLESATGKRLGDLEDPLLVSVRSGAKFSMPGMMDTVLDVGLNAESVIGLAKQSGSERFAWDSYRRLISMFGQTVLGVSGSLFDQALDDMKKARTAASDLGLDGDDLRRLAERYLSIVRDQTGEEFPADPRAQLDQAIVAVFNSWNGERARIYRRQERIPNDLGTAVNVVAMVYGNLGMDSGTGVAFTRDPGTGQPGVYGDYLQDAQGEDVVSGIRNTMPIEALEGLNPAAYHQLLAVMGTLERHYRDMCDIEFTIERATLWILQTRIGKRTPAAAFRIAVQLVDEGVIDLDEALSRVSGLGLATLMFPRFDEASGATRLAKGIAASPGAAVGKAVFDSATAVRWADAGEAVILVRRETNPADLAGMIAAGGVLTSRGGKTSHAAVVARGMGKTCVCGAEGMLIDPARRSFSVPSGAVVAEGDVISVDGTSGSVYLGEVSVVPSPVVRYFEGTLTGEPDDLVVAVDRLLRHADQRRRLAVRANADTPQDAVRARAYGAQGIGLCRTEHMFLGERRKAIEQLILAEDEEARQSALQPLLSLQRDDFEQILEAMDGLPVTVRLLDPPLHEFLPDLTELSVRVAVARATGKAPESEDERLLPAVRRLHEVNPMLGLRGVRLGIMIPGLVALQVRALAEAAAQRIKHGGHPVIEIMVPVVGAVQEVEIVREEAEHALDLVSEETGVPLDHVIGTMIELPRACATARQIAGAADFFSFGTNDLTQTTWGFSRDDCEASFFHRYLEAGIFGVSPFESIDRDGVGQLIELAVAEGRAARPELPIGVCGEHGGDPESIHFFHAVGLDYVSCSPFRVPIARLEAGRAAVAGGGGDTR